MAKAVAMKQAEIQKEMVSLKESVRILRITSVAKYKAATTLLRDIITPLLKEIHNTFDPIVKKANAAVKEARTQRQRHLQPVEQMRDRVRELTGKWNQEQENKRREAEAKERARLEAKAEADRVKETEAMRDLGMEEEAQELEAAPVIIPEVTVRNNAPKVDGVHFREVWSYTVADVHKLRAWLWANHSEMLLPDGKAIGQMVRAMKAECPIGGITVTCKKIPVTGSAW